VYIHSLGKGDQEVDGMRIGISGDVTGEVERFKYLGAFVQRDGGFVVNVKNKTKSDWIKCEEASGVFIS